MKQMLGRDETSDDDLSIAFTNKSKVVCKEHIVTDSYRHLLLPLISLFVSIKENYVINIHCVPNRIILHYKVVSNIICFR